MNQSNPTLAKRIAELERQLSSTKDLLESSMLSEATAKQYAEEVDKQNKELAEQILKLNKRIKAINEGIEEYKSMSNDATADLVHKALMRVREEIIQRDLYQTAPYFIEQFANQYADSIRQGGK